MKISFVFLLFLITGYLSGQNKYLSTGKKNNGVCLGNSRNFNGLRLNLWDHNADTINGLNISGISSAKKLNGVSVGLLASIDSVSNGIQVSGLMARADKHNGLSFGLLGLSGTSFNGIGCSGLVVDGDTLNGVFLGLLGVVPRNKPDTISVIRGVAMGGGIFANSMTGLSVGYLVNKFNRQKGVSIAGVNIASDLNGFQFGLINCAMNNKKPFRWIPILNLHIHKKQGNFNDCKSQQPSVLVKR